MAEVYNATISASGNSGDISVTALTSYGLLVTGKTRIEAKKGSAYETIGHADPSDPGKIIVAPSPTLRLVDESGAANACLLSS